jgi:hypothetical protein
MDLARLVLPDQNRIDKLEESRAQRREMGLVPNSQLVQPGPTFPFPPSSTR